VPARSSLGGGAGRPHVRVGDRIVRDPAQALALELDVTRQDQVYTVVREAIERFGQIDVLVNIDSFSEGLAKVVGPLRIKVITIDPASNNGDPANEVANDIIATVDADSVAIR